MLSGGRKGDVLAREKAKMVGKQVFCACSFTEYLSLLSHWVLWLSNSSGQGFFPVRNKQEKMTWKLIGFERSRLGGHDLWQKVPSSPVTRNRLTRCFVRYASDFISCKKEHRRHETQLLERTTNYVSTPHWLTTDARTVSQQSHDNTIATKLENRKIKN